MNNLFTYIAAVNGANTEVDLLNERHSDNSYQEDEVNVVSTTSTFSFSNGVTLQKREEFDDLVVDGGICQECWISYSVLKQPGSLEVKPKTKMFTNRCQESFWLKINHVQRRGLQK